MFDDISTSQQPSSVPVNQPNPINPPQSFSASAPQQSQPPANIPVAPTAPVQTFGSRPSGISAGVEDIFASVDSPDYSGQLPNPNFSNIPSVGGADLEVSSIAGQRRGLSMVKKILIVLAVLFVGGGAAGLFYFKFVIPPENNANTNTEVDKGLPQADVVDDKNIKKTDEGVDNTTVPVVENKPPVAEPIKIEEPTIVDSDLDGLTDDQEKVFGTDPNLKDTDQDGLSDSEEYAVYKTDPLNSDTDGDGYSDGSEVKNGYNPKGQGKLIDKIDLP